MKWIFQKIKSNYDIILIFLIVFSIKMWIFDVKIVTGMSMYPTINYYRSRDRVVLNRLASYIDNYKHGDIIILKLKSSEKKTIIKRVIGLPGDKIEIKFGHVYLNNVKLQESYLESDVKTFLKNDSIYFRESRVVPEGCLFVLGDNRMGSCDSRDYGFFRYDEILGVVIYRFNLLNLKGSTL